MSLCGLNTVSSASATEGIPAFRNLTELPDETFYDINAVYLGRVTYTDWIFGQLLDGIDVAGAGVFHLGSFTHRLHKQYGRDYEL
jgi:hypothetical protein